MKNSIVAIAFLAAGLATLCLVLSAVTYRLIEAPFLRRKERLRR